MFFHGAEFYLYKCGWAFVFELVKEIYGLEDSVTLVRGELVKLLVGFSGVIALGGFEVLLGGGLLDKSVVSCDLGLQLFGIWAKIVLEPGRESCDIGLSFRDSG